MIWPNTMVEATVAAAKVAAPITEAANGTGWIFKNPNTTLNPIRTRPVSARFGAFLDIYLQTPEVFPTSDTSGAHSQAKIGTVRATSYPANMPRIGERIELATSRQTSLRPSIPTTSTSTAHSVIPVQPAIAGLTNFEPLPDLQTPSVSQHRAVVAANGKQVTVRMLDAGADPRSWDAVGFTRHAQVAARLAGHAATVPLLASDIDSHGRPYVVSPYYARGSLAGFMAGHGPMSWRHATFLMEMVGVTVAELHGSHIVHRHLQPGAISLTDFFSPRLDRFEHCVRIGTPPLAGEQLELAGYHAPELGLAGSANPNMDVYSLGAVLWATLAGHPPPRFEPGQPQPSLATPNPKEPTPASIMDLIARSMSVDAGERPPNGAAFVTELRRAVGAAEASSSSPTRPRSVMSNLSETIEMGSIQDLTIEQDSTVKLNRSTLSPAHQLEVQELATATTQVDPESVSSVEPEPPPNPRLEITDPVVPTRSADTDARWLLVLVAIITVAIVIMVAAAVLAVN